MAVVDIGSACFAPLHCLLHFVRLCMGGVSVLGCPTVPQKLPTLPFYHSFSSVFLFLSLAFAAAAASPPRHTLPSIHRSHSINPVNLPIHPYTYIHYIAVSAVLPPVNRSPGSDLLPIFFFPFSFPYFASPPSPARRHSGCREGGR